MSKILAIKPDPKITNDPLREMEEAGQPPIILDKDREEMPPAMMNAFKSAAVQCNQGKKPTPKEAVLLIGLQARAKSTNYLQILASNHLHINPISNTHLTLPTILQV